MSFSSSEAFAEAQAKVAGCALDEEGISAQRARHERLGSQVTEVGRGADAVIVRFAPGFDRQTLDEVIAVERECCPMFDFAFDEAERRLEITVNDAEQAAALDAVAHAFGGARRGT